MESLELLFYLAIFIASIFTFDLVMNFATSLQSSRALAANRRARMLAEGTSAEETLRRLTRRPVAAGDGLSSISERVSRLEPYLQRAGLKASAQRVAVMVVTAAAVLSLFFWVVVGFPASAAVFLGVVFAAAATFVFMLSRIRSRQARMTEQLPEVIDTIVRSLQAGHPIRAAMGLVAKDVDDPLGTEIGIVVDEMTFGLELDAALNNLRERARISDLDYMIVAINIHSRTGGNLAEILNNLSDVIRDRYRVFKKVRALSAEGRFSAWIIGVIPFVIALILGLNIPNYYQDAARNALFPMIAAAAIGLYAVAIFAIWRIIKIKV